MDDEEKIIDHSENNSKPKKYWICPTCGVIHIFDSVPMTDFECENCGDVNVIPEEYLSNSIEDAYELLDS
jgi:rubrerythrin